MRRPRVDPLGVLTPAVLLGAWEVLARTALAGVGTLPPPSAVVAALARLAASGELAPAAAHTVRVTLVGWLAASVLGAGLGLLLGSWAPAWRWSMAGIEVLRAVPPVTLVPVALLVFGFSMRMELTLIVYAGAWPVLVNTVDGVRSVSGELRDVARVLRLGRVATLRTVVLPASLPWIVVGQRLALSLALVLAVVAEMVGNPAGLGNALVAAQQALRPDEAFAYVAAIGLVGVALNAAYGRLVARAFPAAATGAAGAA